MKLISDHIRLLLHDHDCVVIPGLGGFIQNRFSSAYHANESRYYPNRNVPLFNKQLQSNDGLLAAALVKSQGYSYSDALKEIQRFVDQVKESQEQKRSYPLTGMGVFETNHEGQIAFYPDKNCNVSRDSYGLPALAIHPVSRKTKKNRATLKPIRKRSKRWIAAMSFILFLSVSAWLVKDHSNFEGVQWGAINPFGELWEKPVEPIRGENVGTMESIITEPEVKDEELYQEEEMVENEPIENIEESNTESVNQNIESVDSVYHIIVGAFQVEQNAVSYSNELKSKGFKASTFSEMKSSLVRVSANQYGTRVKAEQELNRIKNEINQGAWILSVPKKNL